MEAGLKGRESSREPYASRRIGLMAAKVERSKPRNALGHAFGSGRGAAARLHRPPKSKA
jgi:hypothetical protein